MAIENAQEVVDYLKKEENKDFLKNNGFTTVETKEIKAPVTEAEVKAFLDGNADLKKQVGTEAVKVFLKEKLGTDVTDENLNESLYKAGDYENLKKLLVMERLAGVQYGDLLMQKIDMTKVKINGDKVEGLDDQVAVLKTTYAGLFNIQGKTNTPPAPPKEEPKSELEKLEAELEDLKAKPSLQNRAKILALTSQINQLKNK